MNRYSKYTDHGSRGFAGSMLPLVALFLLAVGGIAWVCMGIVASDRWPIRWLQLNGSFQRVSAEQLRASLTTRIDESYFTINLQELGDIAQRIYWVSSARVQKQWPDTITVTVQEYKPIAHWNQGSLISSEGEVFPVPEADEIQGLPWLSGPETELDQVLENWARFNDELASAGLEIQHLKLDARGAWSMDLTNGTSVKGILSYHEVDA